MCKLSVNVNKIATLRNARGGNLPNLLKAVRDIEEYGAQGITVHPRPDERHIRYRDVREINECYTTEFNIEGYPSPEFLKLVSEVKPTQVTLVPDPPDVLTSNAGWNTLKHREMLTDIVHQLHDMGLRVSLFIDTDLRMFEAAAHTRADRVELYTEAYARVHTQGKVEEALKPYMDAAYAATDLGLGLNAGHDLNLQNLRDFYRHIPQLLEVSIGHALVCDALYYGLQNTVGMYLHQLRPLT
jgi:pyridoxine 5-phosphate synthase